MSNVHYDPEFFATLFSREEKSFWFLSRNELILWAFRRFFPHARDFCEIGCGTGFVLKSLAERMPRMSLTATDIFPEAIAFASQRVPKARFVLADARLLEFEAAFDVIGAFDVLEHIPEDETALLKMKRSLRRGGALLLTVPQHPSLWSGADVGAGHLRRYTKTGLCQKLEMLGFEVLLATGFVSLLLPELWASRLVSIGSVRADPLAGLALPRFLNTTLDNIMTLERSFIRMGVRFGFGGSLLIAARYR